MTVQDLITRAMRLLGAVNIGDGPTAAEEQDGLTALNAMVDAWANERLMIYTTARNQYPLVAGQAVYQIGPSGPDWTAPRPQSIDAAGLLMGSSDPTQIYERPLEVIKTDKEWARVRLKNLGSPLPLAIYYDRWFSNPNSATNPVGSGNVAVWPVPQVVNQIVLYTPVAVSRFTAQTQTLSLPPGYERALTYNLALEMAPEFDREPSDVVVAIAEQSKAGIKRVNAISAIGKLRVDPALAGRRGIFDWTIGEER
ncbi:MAG TPA: hypothetical protein VFB14_14065 [Bryobacteraceae bacterium]|jgi:hypothetical protein|nr:hypothetical protein [Bryobacteraceae bacterium]